MLFSVTIVSNLEIMQLIPNSTKTRERTQMFLLALDQAYFKKQD